MIEQVWVNNSILTFIIGGILSAATGLIFGTRLINAGSSFWEYLVCSIAPLIIFSILFGLFMYPLVLNEENMKKEYFNEQCTKLTKTESTYLRINYQDYCIQKNNILTKVLVDSKYNFYKLVN